MNSISGNLQTLETFLKLTNEREKTISSNMANVDTPGYRTRDIDFEAEMQKVMSESAMSQSATSQGGSTLELAGYEPGQGAAREVPGLMERPDGNNVNLDREGMLMSEMQLQYQMGIQLVKGQFHSILSAINGGS